MPGAFAEDTGPTVVLADYSGSWPLAFAEASLSLQILLPEATVEHIGSTAVEGLVAKPIIDIMLGTKSLASIEERIGDIEALGYAYVSKHEALLPERRYFTRTVAAQTPVHVHAVVLGSPFWLSHLAFRDALRNDAALTRRYAILKRQLAERHGRDRAAYTAAKGPFIQEVLVSLAGC